MHFKHKWVIYRIFSIHHENLNIYIDSFMFMQIKTTIRSNIHRQWRIFFKQRGVDTNKMYILVHHIMLKLLFTLMVHKTTHPCFDVCYMKHVYYVFFLYLNLFCIGFRGELPFLCSIEILWIYYRKVMLDFWI